MNNNSNGPLMFINSVQTNAKEAKSQKVFDSRNPKKISTRQNKEIKLSDIEIKKLENTVTLYKKNIPVTCKINCSDLSIEGIPIEINESYLVCDSNNEKTIIPLCDIIDFLIVSF